MDNDKGDSKSPPNSKVNASGMADLRSTSTVSLVKNKEEVTIVQNALRYDNVFSTSNDKYISSKKLFSSFSAVGDTIGECVPTHSAASPH
jgi:hypothetical protein